jgi:hypothetical protein
MFRAMLLTEDTSDDGELRIHFTRSSVVSYFTDDDDGGVKAHASPSDFACPWSTTPDKLHAVKMEMLATRILVSMSLRGKPLHRPPNRGVSHYDRG